MASLRRPPSKEKHMVGRFLPDGCCKKHPKHRQSPGVCSLCLRHKLSQLSSHSSSSSSSFRKPTSPSSSASSLSSYYSSSASSCASPALPFPYPNDPKSGSNSLSIFPFSAMHGGVLKSRSMSVVATRTRTRRREGEGISGDDHNNNNSNYPKKSGFWSKLLHPKTKRMDIIKDTKLLHTKSLIETVS